MKSFIFLCSIIFFSGSFISCMNSTENRQEMVDRDTYQLIKHSMATLTSDALLRRDIYALMAISSFKIEAGKDEWEFIHRGPRVTYHLYRVGLSNSLGQINQEYLRVWQQYHKENSAK